MEFAGETKQCEIGTANLTLKLYRGLFMRSNRLAFDVCTAAEDRPLPASHLHTVTAADRVSGKGSCAGSGWPVTPGACQKGAWSGRLGTGNQSWDIFNVFMRNLNSILATTVKVCQRTGKPRSPFPSCICCICATGPGNMPRPSHFRGLCTAHYEGLCALGSEHTILCWSTHPAHDGLRPMKGTRKK